MQRNNLATLSDEELANYLRTSRDETKKLNDAHDKIKLQIEMQRKEAKALIEEGRRIIAERKLSQSPHATHFKPESAATTQVQSASQTSAERSDNSYTQKL